MKCFTLFPLFAGVLTLGALGDVVLLNNGRRIEGTVVRESESEVVLRLPDGNRLRLARKMIKEVRKSAEPPPRADEPPPALPQPPLKLRWSMQPGKEVKYTTRYRYQTEVGNAQPSYEEWGNEMTLRCESARVDELELVLTLTRARHTKRNDQETLETDTAHKDPAKRGDTNMIGQPITLRLSKRGEVLELVSFGGMRFADIEDKQGRRKMEKAISEYILRTHLLGLVGTFPDEAVTAERQSWEELMVIPNAEAGDMTLKIVNALGASTAREFTVVQRGGLAIHGMNARLLKKSQTRGKVVFSRTAGHLVKVRQRTESTLHYEVGDEEVPAKMVITLDVDSE